MNFHRSEIIAAGFAAILLAPVHAVAADGDRDVSVFDQNPGCMDRGELPPGSSTDRPDCLLPSAQDFRGHLGNVTSAGPPPSTTGATTNGIAMPGSNVQTIRAPGTAAAGSSATTESNQRAVKR